jgi:hypothetical protein
MIRCGHAAREATPTLQSVRSGIRFALRCRFWLDRISGALDCASAAAWAVRAASPPSPSSARQHHRLTVAKIANAAGTCSTPPGGSRLSVVIFGSYRRFSDAGRGAGCLATRSGWVLGGAGRAGRKRIARCRLSRGARSS